MVFVLADAEVDVVAEHGAVVAGGVEPAGEHGLGGVKFAGAEGEVFAGGSPFVADAVHALAVGFASREVGLVGEVAGFDHPAGVLPGGVDESGVEFEGEEAEGFAVLVDLEEDLELAGGVFGGVVEVVAFDGACGFVEPDALADAGAGLGVVVSER